jgi:hypothetical protein
LPKPLAESKNQVLPFSSFSVTLLRLNVYYLIIHGIKQFTTKINLGKGVSLFPFQ